MRIILLITLALIVSCSSTSSYNPTVFEYAFDQEKFNQQPLKKVVFATTPLGSPPPSYLKKSDRKIRAMVRNYLQDNGYSLLPNYHFENAWKQANRTYGDVYDPTTGEIDMNAWRGAMITTGKIIREQTDAELIIFSDLLVHDVQHSNSMKHYARWYGVTRKPTLIGSGSGTPVDFDWSKPIKAASLMITIYDVELNQLFASRGGLDTLYALDIKRSTPSFTRKKKLLSNESNLEEGIELAFHPFITMKGYPGKKD